MSEDVEDLWGDLGELEIPRTPKSILQEQAGVFEEKFKPRLLARVFSDDAIVASARASSGSRRYDMGFTLAIVVPKLNSYRYEVASIAHSIELYPLYLEGQSIQVCPDEIAFTAALSKTLASASIRSAIGSLLAQIPEEW